jgi:16S rRNA (guanine1207-N2)-methyltransferase
LESQPPRPAEQLLIDAVSGVEGTRFLCRSLGRAQLAAAIARQRPEARVGCHFLDIYLAEQARAFHAEGPQNLSIYCQADLPSEEVDVVAFPTTASGEAELTRDLLQQAHQALALDGQMLVSTDNPNDSWLREQMQKLFDRAKRTAGEHGVLYEATKTRRLGKLKDFGCEFAFRDQGRLIRAVSRPGVFSHRRLDLGARALMEVMEVREGERVVDMGCGAGVISFAAAFRAPGVTVDALDSNPRAVQCTQRGAALNGLESITARLNAEGRVPEPGSYDLFLGNPPYYSNYRISEIFLQAARQALRPGGRVLMVTKHYEWYAQQMSEWFADVAVRPSRAYFVIEGVQPETVS